jgi:hypothetical protein
MENELNKYIHWTLYATHTEWQVIGIQGSPLVQVDVEYIIISYRSVNVVCPRL